MAVSKLEKYVMRDVWDKEISIKAPYPGIPYPTLKLLSDKNFGNQNFRIFWTAIAKPTTISDTPHFHEHSQFLMFVGGDLTNMVDLGGEVELTLSEDGKNLEKFVFTKAACVFIPGGLWHCPLKFTKINDPKKPILFNDMFLNVTYDGKMREK
jgi:hypothetical protein